MGGSIEVASQPGAGTTFTVRLGLRAGEATALAAGKVLASGKTRAQGLALASSMAGKKILVVDDDPVNRRVAVCLLRELGAEAVEAESGHAAIAELGRRRMDLVLMDCSMPGMDGYETTRRIRDAAYSSLDPGTLILAMTARTSPADRARAKASGMDDYVVKPVTLASRAAALERIEFRSGPEEEEEAGEPSPASDPVFDGPAFRARFDDAKEAGDEILELFLSQSRPLLEEARAALAGGDAQAAVAGIHRLKGSAGAIGGLRAARAAEAFLAAESRPSADAAELSALLEAFSRELADLEAEAEICLRG
jgi:CheY-like chemotaxis protein